MQVREELPALTTWQQIGLILATPGYNDGAAFLDEGDMADIARLLDEYKAERDAERDALRAKLLNELSNSKTQRLQVAAERDAARAEVAALRAALVSLVDGKSEFDIEYDTGMPADEARRIMDLAYNRK
jgi:hypothetical protein